MRLRLFLTFALICIVSFSFAQEFNKRAIETKNNEEILIGKCTYDAIFKFMPDFDSKMKAYNPDQKIVETLKNKLGDITFIVVLGTWCDDSKDQVPVFAKLVSLINFDQNNINYICVDRTKNTKDYNDTDLKIEKVPTFIILRNNKEIGRIIETPVQTMEFDLSKIITGN